MPIDDKRRVVTGSDTKMMFISICGFNAEKNEKNESSICIAIPKDDADTIHKIEVAMKAAYTSGTDKLKGATKTVPAYESLKKPLRDGDVDRAGNPDFEGCYFVNAKTIKTPVIVDANKNPITDPSEIYSGIYGRASITFYAYNTNGNRGIACGLNGIQKLTDGKRLDGSSSATSDFTSAATTDNLDFLD